MIIISADIISLLIQVCFDRQLLDHILQVDNKPVLEMQHDSV